MKSLTKTERRVMEALAHGKPDGGVTLRGLRLLMRLTARHEAGHVAARMFTGMELSHVVCVSIIPNEESLGRETTEQCTEEAALEACPSEAQKQATGRQLLITLLAGRAAVARKYVEDDRNYILHSNPEEWEIEGSDVSRAKRIAKIMAGPSRPYWPVLRQAGKWTAEVMDIPQVAQGVRRMADRLVEDGSIEGDSIMDACEEVYLLGLSLPKWRRRLYAVAAKP